MKGKTGRQKGCIPWNKGKTGIYSKETLRKIGLAHIGKSPFEGHNWGPDKCKKCGKNHGIPPMTGTHFSPETCLKLSLVRRGRKLTEEWKKNIGLAMRASEKFHYAMYLYGLARVITAMETVREMYDLPETAKFIPVSVSEHIFARRVLIQGKPGDGLISNWEENTPDWKKKEKSILRLIGE